MTFQELEELERERKQHEWEANHLKRLAEDLAAERNRDDNYSVKLSFNYQSNRFQLAVEKGWKAVRSDVLRMVELETLSQAKQELIKSRIIAAQIKSVLEENE